ncbi:MAG: hypothetical protein AAF458_24050 [Pseudomonadota bacterium]
MNALAEQVVEVSPVVPLRSPELVMRLERMGAAHQSRLSFLRILLRRLADERWSFERTRFDIDAAGVGTALYQLTGPVRTYTLVAFAHDLDPTMRSDRVIAEAWDATFTLYDGVPEQRDIDRLRAQVPSQEAGHLSERELTLSRANRSVRLFEHVVACLARGAQPDASALDEVGYLMRTTAVYGSGKFGVSDRRALLDRDEFGAPFQVEMMTVWLIRAFTVDIVEHLAAVRAPRTACRLAAHLRRRLGVGNSTGLGMAPFMVTHPALIDRWFTVRETALARVRSQTVMTADDARALARQIGVLQRDAEVWRTTDVRQQARIAAYRGDLEVLARFASRELPVRGGWNVIYEHAESVCAPEACEALVGLLIDAHPEIVDALAARLAIDETALGELDGAMPVSALVGLIERRFGYALALDFDSAAATARFWYTSVEKLEPRLGERSMEPGQEREHPLAVARDVAALYAALADAAPDQLLSDWLATRVEYRHTARRVQLAGTYPYAEIRDNVIDADMLPLDILRCKLAFFGATRFDPRSDRWVRINLFQRAPYPDEMPAAYRDDWIHTEGEPGRSGDSDAELPGRVSLS